jgi:hemerythrin-like domain-containing protein
MTTPSEALREEHRVILRALETLEAASERLAAGQALPEGWWEALVRWLRAFADWNHHAKEERYLFPALVRAGVPATGGGPIAVMLAEHVQGRGLVQAMEGGDSAQRVRAARGYVLLLRDHIEKENGVLLPLSDAVLEEQDQRRLARDFQDVEAEQGREASVEHAEAALERLRKVLG